MEEKVTILVPYRLIMTKSAEGLYDVTEKRVQFGKVLYSCAICTPGNKCLGK